MARDSAARKQKPKTISLDDWLEENKPNATLKLALIVGRSESGIRAMQRKLPGDYTVTTMEGEVVAFERSTHEVLWLAEFVGE